MDNLLLIIQSHKRGKPMKKTGVTALSAAQEAETKARRSILVWAGVPLPIRRSDADESPDPVELVGYSAIRQDIVAKSTGCNDCTQRSDACDNCEHSGTSEDDHVFVREALVETNRVLAMMMQLPKFPVLHTRNDGRHYVHLSAPSFRGRERVISELRVLGRMNF